MLTQSNKTVSISISLEHWPATVSSQLISTPRYVHSALWLQSGTLLKNGITMAEGTGCYLTPGDRLDNSSDSTTVVIRIVFSSHTDSKHSRQEPVAIQSSEVATHTFSTQLTEATLRLDQVDFPPGAIAYKHTHPGAGVRYLVDGGLKLESDHGTTHYQAGEAWFEDADSPVRATAIAHTPSRFIRLMLLPVEYEGQSTLTLLNANDAHKPRLQTNTRHFDKRVTV